MRKRFWNSVVIHRIRRTIVVLVNRWPKFWNLYGNCANRPQIHLRQVQSLASGGGGRSVKNILLFRYITITMVARV